MAGHSRGKRSDDEELVDIDFDEEEDEQAIIERRRKEREKLLQKLKAEFSVESQLDENSVDSMGTATQSKESANEEELDLEDGDEKIEQFDFEESMNAKKESAQGVHNGLVNKLGAVRAAGLAHESQQLMEGAADELLDKGEAMKQKRKAGGAFDMFASDDEYETGTKNALVVDSGRGMAHGNNDNWDDAEGYYSECGFMTI